MHGHRDGCGCVRILTSTWPGSSWRHIHINIDIHLARCLPLHCAALLCALPFPIGPDSCSFSVGWSPWLTNRQSRAAAHSLKVGNIAKLSRSSHEFPPAAGGQAHGISTASASSGGSRLAAALTTGCGKTPRSPQNLKIRERKNYISEPNTRF